MPCGPGRTELAPRPYARADGSKAAAGNTVAQQRIQMTLEKDIPALQERVQIREDKNQELEANLGEARLVICALCSHAAMVKDRSVEAVPALERRSSMALQDKRAEGRQQQQQRCPSNEGVEYTSMGASDYDEAFEAQEDGEWAIFVSENFSPDLEHDLSADERRSLQSRAERDSGRRG